MNNMSLAFLMVLSVSVVANSTVAREKVPAPAEELTDKVRNFLKKEMGLLADGGRTIEEALAADDSTTVAEEAAKMHETFVHKDEVTTFDLRILKAELGDEFVERDKAFHGLVRQLEAYAREGKADQQQRVFQDMLKACAGCHAAYAPEAPVLE